MSVIRFDTLAEMVEAMKRDDIPAQVVSPGRAAELLGVTRQAINDRLYHTNSLDAWIAEGYVLVSVESIERAKPGQRRKAKVS